jgi:lipopolysaccharide biosynthesis regulator YciM
MNLLWLIPALLFVVLLVIVIVFLSKRRSQPPVNTYQDALKALLDGRELDAMRRLRDTVMHDTDNVDAYIRLGRLIREKGDAEKAANIHQSLTVRATLKRDEELRIYEELVEDYSAMGRVEKAVDLLKEILRLAHDKPPYLRRLLAMLVARQRTDEVFELLRKQEKTLGDKKETASWYAENARIQIEKGDPKALESLKNAQRLSKDHPYVIIVQAKQFMKTEQPAKARPVLERFLKLYPDDAECVLDLIEHVYFELGIYEKVVGLYDGLLKKYPQKRDVRLRLARIRTKEGAEDEAVALIDAALVENPNDVPFIIERVNLYLADGKLDAARDTFERLEDILVSSSYVCPECGQTLGPESWFCTSCGAPVN